MKLWVTRKQEIPWSSECYQTCTQGCADKRRPDDDVLKEQCGRSIWYPSERYDNTTVTKLIHGRIVW